MADVLDGETPDDSLEVLRDAASRRSLPVLQLIGYAGLIVACKRAGDQAATAELRRALRVLAPHFDALLFEPTA